MRWRRKWLVLVPVALMLAACGGGGDEESGESGERIDPDAVVVNMLYGSEKEAWLTEATRRFNDGDHALEDGRQIHVTAEPSGSGESLDRILSGEGVDVWSPASSLYLPLAQERGLEFDETQAEPLVLSPVVIGMWRPMAEALGWPDRQLGWRELADLVRSGKTWADYGHPEWGEFQFGHTHPDYSNSGLTTVVGLAYAGAGKTDDLTVGDVRKQETQKLIREVEGSVAHYGSSTGFFANNMFDRGPAYLSAAVMYESSVIESYDGSLHPNTDLPVVAIYPKEGSFWSDHPFVVPGTVSGEKKEAAEAYRSFLLEAPQQQAALKYGFRPGNVDVPSGAPIDAEHGVDPSQLRTELPTPTVEVIEAAREAWQANKKPVDVQVVFDTSGSMEQEDRLPEAKRALVDFLGRFAAGDRVGITVFNTESYELSPLTEIGPKRQELVSQVEGLFPAGDTRLYDTTAESYEKLNAEPAGDRIRALVVLTDGRDNLSQTSLDGLLERLRMTGESASSTKVFAIAYGSDADADALENIAESTGAKGYQSDPEAIEAVYDDIATFF